MIKAAESALARRSFVSAIDILEGIGWLQHKAVEDWRRGRTPCLEQVVQANLSKLSDALRLLRIWAEGKGLKASETRYMRWGRGASQELQFSVSGAEAIERAYRTHYVSPTLSEKERQNLQQKLEKPKEPVVFLILREAECSECGAGLEEGGFLAKDGELALCLPCAGLGDLVYLPSGDATLTRRAGKNSKRSAVVVRFSRSRGRYERQGMLVEEEALAKAEAECVDDAAERARGRMLAAQSRLKTDVRFAAEFTLRILELYPRCPQEEARRIAAHTSVRGSGRVGRTAAGRALHEKPVSLAVRAYVRHQHTDYDALLVQGIGREEARGSVLQKVEDIVRRWS